MTKELQLLYQVQSIIEVGRKSLKLEADEGQRKWWAGKNETLEKAKELRGRGTVEDVTRDRL